MLTHVVKEHSADHEIMEPFVLVPLDLLVIQPPLAVPTEIVGSVTNVLAGVSVTNVLAAVTDVLATLLAPPDTSDSLMITSHHCFKN